MEFIDHPQGTQAMLGSTLVGIMQVGHTGEGSVVRVMIRSRDGDLIVTRLRGRRDRHTGRWFRCRRPGQRAGRDQRTMADRTGASAVSDATQRSTVRHGTEHPPRQRSLRCAIQERCSPA